MLLSSLTRESTIRVHFWNLEKYVGGELVGDWVELDECGDIDEFKAKVAEVVEGAEEFLLGDSECDYGVTFSEYPGLDKIWETHEAICEVHVGDRDAFGEYLSHLGGIEYLDEAISNWQDAFCGNFESMEDYAWNYAEEVYPELASLPAGFTVRVDTIAWEQDHWISSTGNVFRYV